MTTDHATKVRENRVRRAAHRQGLILVKSRSRDPRAIGYGTYVLVDDKAGNKPSGGQAAISAFRNGEGLTLHQIEEQLTGGTR